MNMNGSVNTLFLVIIFFLFLSCNPQKTLDEFDENEEIIACDTSSQNITEEASVAIYNGSEPIFWEGIYSDDFVRISYTKTVGTDEETETHHFVFKKIDHCIKVERIYKFYNGKLVDVSAITELKIISFYVQDWKLNEKFVGVVTYQDHHDKNTYKSEFWIEFEEENYRNEIGNFEYFSDCFSSKLPIDIDMNNDDTIDFKLAFEEIRNDGNKPAYSEYTIKLISTDYSVNSILSPRQSSSPHFVVFEAPFSSENTRQYFNGVKNTLDVFYEFDEPYQQYNYFLNNILTYRKMLENNLDDYYIVSIIINGETHYGWIKFKFNSSLCEAEIIETYLNPVANKHVEVL